MYSDALYSVYRSGEWGAGGEGFSVGSVTQTPALAKLGNKTFGNSVRDIGQRVFQRQLEIVGFPQVVHTGVQLIQHGVDSGVNIRPNGFVEKACNDAITG